MQRCVKCPPFSIQTDDKKQKNTIHLVCDFKITCISFQINQLTFLVLSGSATSSGFINSHTEHLFCKYEWQNTHLNQCVIHGNYTYVHSLINVLIQIHWH